MIYLKSNIMYLKEEMDISYRKLCKESKISRPTIRNILSIDDFSNVSLGTVIKLANYFNITIDELLNKDLSLTNRR